MIRPDCIEVYPDRAAWLAARRKLDGSCPHAMTGHYRIGASDIGKILGVSPHGGAWDVWLDKREGRAEADNEDMAQGRRWERRVLEDYAEATGRAVLSPTISDEPTILKGTPYGDSYLRHEPCAAVLVRHPDLPWAVASPDGFSAERIPLTPGRVFAWGPWGGLEAKAIMDPGSAAEWEEETQIIEPGSFDRAQRWPAPRHMALQCYWSLAVSGLPFWDLAAILMPRRGRLVWHRFLADPDLQAALVEQVGEWRARHLVGGEEPPVDASTAAWSYYASRPHEAPLREATPEERALALELHRTSRQVESGLAQMHRLRNELGARLRDCKGVALGPAVGRKKPPRIAWEGGGEQRKEAQPARTITVRPHLHIRGIEEES